MKIILLLICAGAAPALLAQNDRQAIQQWQSQHPSTLLISQERYNSLPDRERQLLGDDIIVYQDNITLALLEQHSAAKSDAVASDTGAKDEDAILIKQWLAEHRDVKILPRSYYESLTEEKRAAYDPQYCMILLGESITVKDIELFEHH